MAEGLFCLKQAHSTVCCRNHPWPYSNPHSFNHILSPPVDELIELETSILIPTHQVPEGHFVQVKLLCAYGDVLATKWVVGFSSHSATKFFSFCHAEQVKISKSQLSRRQEKAKQSSSATNSKK
ncbi:hypothetical protein VP01_4524g1 [Puccinia sorghi]|uniref:Uncharacterized protein n=1 Tax=Puccinia sorghi TaxID=27349 RepID=A0A0L6UP00_9BASI|nr:hypothetical protein VP01_4524g1 [Puccinia sorghi]